MKLVEIGIENFYGFEQKASIKAFDFNVLVGRNDVGKSSVLKALDLFLNDKTPSAETSNLYTQSGDVVIELSFLLNSQSIVIDDTIETTFENEELVNSQGLLIVKKSWDTSQTKPKPQVFIYRKQYEVDDFVFATESQLIKLCQKYSIQTQKANGEEYNNVEKRTKLREHYQQAGINFKYEWEKLPTTASSTRQRQVFDVLKNILPRFEFFKADTSLSETDTAIQNYFRDLATQTLIELGMKQAEEEVEKRLGVVLNSIAQKINASMPLNETVKPSTEFDWSKVVKIAFVTGENEIGIPLQMRGDGFRRVAMMAYFEHLAEERREPTRDVIFGFEEPETYLHPKAQEQLFEKLRDMAESSYQIFVSTHSPIIVARSKHSELIHVAKENGRTKIDCSVSDLKAIAEDLGITVDNQFVQLFDKAKIIFLVEGIDDATSYQFVAQKYKENGLIEKTFEEMGIVLIPIGGCTSIEHWVTLDFLKKLSKPFFIFLDSDCPSQSDVSPNQEKMIGLGLVEGKDFFVTQKRMLENYIPPDSLNTFVPNANISYGNWDNVKDICKKHPLAGHLGGKSVAERHFTKLTFGELQKSFTEVSGDDEFLRVYNHVCTLLK